MIIGIIGGGQLARMIIEECSKFGYNFKIFTAEKDSPAGQISAYEFVGNLNNTEDIKNFSKDCNIITLENEFIDYEILKKFESFGVKIKPDPEIIKLIQDKLIQKETLRSLGIPVADFSRAENEKDINDFGDKFGYPVILKSRTMGYDGKGNYQINSPSEINSAIKILSQRGELMCEKYIDFTRELAVQAVRNGNGEIRIYPVVESIQKNHICSIVKASAEFQGEINDKVKKYAEKILSDLSYEGVMGIELFQTGNKDIIINELAPRVHNTGHYTIEGCKTSQFENHIRAILNYPLGSTEMTANACVMLNILGDKESKANLHGIESVLKEKDSYIHIYGKKETKKGRKMGHITVKGENLAEALFKAKSILEKINI